MLYLGLMILLLEFLYCSMRPWNSADLTSLLSSAFSRLSNLSSVHCFRFAFHQLWNDSVLRLAFSYKRCKLSTHIFADLTSFRNSSSQVALPTIPSKLSDLAVFNLSSANFNFRSAKFSLFFTFPSSLLCLTAKS